MVRKPRVHVPGALDHSMLRGNSGEEIFSWRDPRSASAQPKLQKPDTYAMTQVPETTIYCTSQIRDLWPDPLASRWAEEYPQLFDEDDLRLTRTQPRNHFAEWFAAIHLFQRDGVHALVEKYVYQNHPRKVALFESLLSESERAAVNEICMAQGVQPPDLLLFPPGRGGFSFAEVKSPGDRLSPKQKRSHAALARELQVSIELVNVRIHSVAA